MRGTPRRGEEVGRAALAPGQIEDEEIDPFGCVLEERPRERQRPVEVGKHTHAQAAGVRSRRMARGRLCAAKVRADSCVKSRDVQVHRRCAEVMRPARQEQVRCLLQEILRSGADTSSDGTYERSRRSNRRPPLEQAVEEVPEQRLVDPSRPATEREERGAREPDRERGASGGRRY